MNNDPALAQQVWDHTAEVLMLTPPPRIQMAAPANTQAPASTTSTPNRDMAL